MDKKRIRAAYLLLTRAIKEKPINKQTTPKRQLLQIDDSAHFIRQLQDIGVYLGVVK